MMRSRTVISWLNVVARKAREIADDAENLGEHLTEKPVTLAINEVAAGEVQVDPEDLYNALNAGRAADPFVPGPFLRRSRRDGTKTLRTAMARKKSDFASAAGKEHRPCLPRLLYR